MKITALTLNNVRGFKGTHNIAFSNSINILIGANNSGKSTILNCILELQTPNLTKNDVSIGAPLGSVDYQFLRTKKEIIRDNIAYTGLYFELDKTPINFKVEKRIIDETFHKYPNIEPNNLIYPYLSKRKVVNFNNQMNEVNAKSVIGNFTNLYSKIDRLITPQHPDNQQYIKACNSILGFEISTDSKGNGKEAVYFIDRYNQISLTSMGEGVTNILGLITDLCVAENNIFLIEEPENDIHPKALKALLNLILEKSTNNQFFISTHSNIVMKYLGIPEAKIFNITNSEKDIEKPKLFLSKIEEISNNPEDRRQILEDLGYDFFDYDLWKAWLFLEEASAETLIRDYFIDWFVPKLKNKS